MSLLIQQDFLILLTAVLFQWAVRLWNFQEDQSEIDSIIITHWHNDHVGGIPNVVKEVIGHEVIFCDFHLVIILFIMEL